MTTTDFNKQATDFLEKHKIGFSTKFIGNDKHFPEDKEERDRFKCTFIKRLYPIKTLEIRFGQSINNSTGTGSKKPTAYDVLTCITKYDPETFNNFCSEYGYDTDSRKAERVYQAVMQEWNEVSKFFTAEELEEMKEIY